MLPIVLISVLTLPNRVSVEIDPKTIVNRFVPALALGAGIDGHDRGGTLPNFRPDNVDEMRTMGLRSLTYRLRTELGIEAWHWNPDGTWSDSKHKQGYWLSNPKPRKPIDLCWGYSLPRRGDTIDQANNGGYSRLDDGSKATFWKSNPYLDPHFTHEPPEAHPQWILTNFFSKAPIDAIGIDWGTPYAVRFRVEYWDGPPRVNDRDPSSGRWRDFPNAQHAQGRAGDQLVRLCDRPILAQYVRIWLETSSHTAPSGSRDIRDRLGFAIRELRMGTLDARGRLRDRIRHRKKATQTEMIVSSTDPWHRSTDRDPDIEQPGFDLVEHSGLTNGLPMLIPAAVLYGVPQDAANELKWLLARGYPIRAVEMGEEPDGQMVSPEDYGCLYLQVANRLRRISKSIRLGGPCFQTTQHEFRDWPEARGPGWFERFLAYLRSRHRLSDFQFFSFEWYPFDDVTAKPETQLLAHAGIFERTIRRLETEGLTHRIPWMITEYGYSAFAGPAEVNLPAAILNSDIVGEFLTMGGNAAFMYGYEPGDVIREHANAWGNLMAIEADDDGDVQYRLPAFYSAWLLTNAWCGRQSLQHTLCATTVRQASPDAVGAYSVLRPDGKVAVMMVNRSRSSSASVNLMVAGRRVRGGELYRYGPAQYAWKSAGENGHPIRTLPPVKTHVADASHLLLPPWSVSILVLGS